MKFNDTMSAIQYLASKLMWMDETEMKDKEFALRAAILEVVSTSDEETYAADEKIHNAAIDSLNQY